jgi:hypothetical protein
MKQKLMWIGWPAFLVAGVLELLVFAVVDPLSLHWFGQPLGLSRQAVYAMGFLVFWAAAAVGGALTLLLAMPPQEVNHPL